MKSMYEALSHLSGYYYIHDSYDNSGDTIGMAGGTASNNVVTSKFIQAPFSKGPARYPLIPPKNPEPRTGNLKDLNRWQNENPMDIDGDRVHHATHGKMDEETEAAVRRG